jgi:hypothetical protein
VAITILILAISGVSSALRTSISSYTLSRDQVIAFYLAQEGFEFIRNMRDENALNNRNWLTGIAANVGDPCYFGIAPNQNVCTVDPVRSNIPILCGPPGSCPIVRQDGTTFFYGYDPTWNATKFRRQIILSQINANEISVTVTVDWVHGSTNKQFRAQENLLSWP